MKRVDLKKKIGIGVSNCGWYLFVCDCNNYLIQLFNARNGALVKSYGSKASDDRQYIYLTGICISPSSQIIVSEYDNRVQIFE